MMDKNYKERAGDLQKIYNQLPDDFQINAQFEFYLHSINLLVPLKDPKYANQYKQLENAFAAGASQAAIFIEGKDKDPAPIDSVDTSNPLNTLTFIVDKIKKILTSTTQFWVDSLEEK